MSFNILIASHFHLQIRYEFFKDTIKSLQSQTLKPIKILISYSKEKDIKTDVNNLFYESFNDKNIEYYINYSDKKLSQFEHFFEIYKSNQINSEWICFCDDDDMYHHERLEIFNKNILSNPGYNSFKDYFSLIGENSTYNNMEFIRKRKDGQDFANFVVSKCFLIEFFEEMINEYHIDIKKGTTDCFFKVVADRNCINIKEDMYFYRKCPFICNYNYWKC